jgi:hypothetical protein
MKLPCIFLSNQNHQKKWRPHSVPWTFARHWRLEMTDNSRSAQEPKFSSGIDSLLRAKVAMAAERVSPIKRMNKLANL